MEENQQRHSQHAEGAYDSCKGKRKGTHRRMIESDSPHHHKECEYEERDGCNKKPCQDAFPAKGKKGFGVFGAHSRFLLQRFLKTTVSGHERIDPHLFLFSLRLKYSMFSEFLQGWAKKAEWLRLCSCQS